MEERKGCLFYFPSHTLGFHWKRARNYGTPFPLCFRWVSNHLQPATPLECILHHWDFFDPQTLEEKKKKKTNLILICTGFRQIMICRKDKLGFWREALISILSWSWTFSVNARANDPRSHMCKTFCLAGHSRPLLTFYSWFSPPRGHLRRGCKGQSQWTREANPRGVFSGKFTCLGSCSFWPIPSSLSRSYLKLASS